MGQSVELSALQSAVRMGQVEWQRHALERMAERGITRTDVKTVLTEGQRIEDYPDAYPLPAALFLGWRDDGPLHVVAAYDVATTKAYVITTYTPSEELFEPDFQTRRQT